MLLGATGGRLYYEELWDVSMDHIIDVTNHVPEGSTLSPLGKVGGRVLEMDDMVDAFGAEVWYYDAPGRRVTKANTLDTPGRRGIYVGRSNITSGGHRIVHIEWDVRKQMWSLGEGVDR